MLTLRAGESSLVLAPEIGGCIVGWSLGDTPLLRRPLPDALLTGNPRGLACFPLIPFSNRINHGRFRWAGRDYQLDRNFGDHPHTIHGVGWQRAWKVEAIGSASATLSLQHRDTGQRARRWPFAFDAEMRFQLTPEALRVTLELHNRHNAAAPAGLGMHPYFPCDQPVRLRFVAGSVWRNGEDSLPSVQTPVPVAWNHADGLPIGSVVLDNCFADWSGEAIVAWENGLSICISAPGLFRHLVVYTPPGQDFFCVEPVSHMTDAINRLDGTPWHGLMVLEPDETLNGEVTFHLASGI